MSNHFRACYRAFRPSPEIRTLLWAIEHISNQEGRPYDHAAYPHLGAPGGPMDAFDDPRIRTISLQWATRLGKTFFGQVCLTKTGDTDPAPMMFASSVEGLAKEGVSRLYASVRKDAHLNSLLSKPDRQQRQDLVEFRGCKIYVAWSRSVSTLADKNIKVGHGGEWDKWEHQSTSKEAHPHKLFDDRFKDYQAVRKVIYEGTPTVKGRSPIERKRLSGSNCGYFVPCPHCKKYQRLIFGSDTEHGIKWDKDSSGKHDAEIAYRSARYICEHCGQSAWDHHRAWMMRRGVWVPEGCQVNHKQALKITERLIEDPAKNEWSGWATAKWVKGTPNRDGQDYSAQLSSLYALSLGWGDIAQEFVKSKSVPQWMRNFVNQWLGETWEIHERKTTWEQLGQRIIVPVPHKVVPTGFSLITMGVDKQQEHYVVCVDAWKSMRTSHTLHYGVYSTLEKIESDLLGEEFARQGGGVLPIKCTLIDGRYRPHDVYKFCLQMLKKKRAVFPAFGSPNSLGVECRKATLGKETSMPGFPCVHVDVTATNDYIEQQVHTLHPGDPGSTSLYSGSASDHQDFLEQMLNEAIVPKIDSQNYTKEVWERIDESMPNDYRDAKRLAYVGMIVSTRNAEILDGPSHQNQSTKEDRGTTPKADRKSEAKPKRKFNFKRRKKGE